MNSINERIVFFDGVCNLCNSSVQFLIDRDSKNQLKFSSLQSDFAQDFFRKNHFSTNAIDSIVYFRKGVFLSHSTAALYLAKDIGYPWKIFTLCLVLPKFFRDAIYKLIAKNRYKIFGKSDYCRVMTSNLRDKFL